MRSLSQEVEINQYPIMVSDLKFMPHAVMYFFSSMCLDRFVWLVVMFFRFVTSGEIQKRSQFFEPFILGLTNSTVEQVCTLLDFVVIASVLTSVDCKISLSDSIVEKLSMDFVFLL